MATSAGRTGVRATLAREVRPVDVVLLSLVPATAVVVFFLPEPLRRSLAFSYVDPTPLTAVTATFVHLGVEHLLANLLGYGFVVGTGYGLAVLADRRRLFGTAAVTYLLAVGPLLWVLNLAVPRQAIGFGLSGVNMAFAGLLPIVLVEFVRRRLADAVRPRHAPLPFFLVLTGVALIAAPPSRITTGVALLSGVLAVVYAASLVAALRGESWGDSRREGWWLETAVVGAILTVGYPLIGFPSEPASGAGVVNLYVHFLGYGLAFIGPYVAMEAGLFD